MGRLSVSILVVGLLGACGGASGTVAKGKVASVSQIAGVVAQERDTILAGIDKTVPCTLSFTDAACALSAQLNYQIIATAADGLVLALDNATNPKNADYLGAYPQELTVLVERTVDAANAAKASVDALANARCFAAKKADCEKLNVTFTFAVVELKNEMQAWAPYLS